MTARALLSLSLALASLGLSHAAIILPTFFTDGMVLQQEPQTAQVWGTTDDTANPVAILMTCVSGYTGNYDGIIVRFFNSKYF